MVPALVKFSGPLAYCDLKSGGYRVVAPLRVFVGSCFWTFRIFDKHTGARLAGCDGQGWLEIELGYQWDGASVIPDRDSNMRASLVHDVLYEAMRRSLIPTSMRQKADALFRDIAIEDGAWGWAAGLDYIGLRLFAAGAARPRVGDTEPEDKTKVAP